MSDINITKEELLSIVENVDDNKSFIEFETTYLRRRDGLSADPFLSQIVNPVKQKRIILIRIEEEL